MAVNQYTRSNFLICLARETFQGSCFEQTYIQISTAGNVETMASDLRKCVGFEGLQPMFSLFTGRNAVGQSYLLWNHNSNTRKYILANHLIYFIKTKHKRNYRHYLPCAFNRVMCCYCHLVEYHSNHANLMCLNMVDLLRQLTRMLGHVPQMIFVASRKSQDSSIWSSGIPETQSV